MAPLSLIAILIIILSMVIPFTRKISFVHSVAIANFIIFFITTFTSPNYMPYGSSVFDDLVFDPAYLQKPEMLYTLITSMFIHYDIMHLLGNMIALFFIGMPFEHRIGAKKIFTIYIFGGIFATLFFSAANFHSMLLMGASGAIFSLLGGFAAAFPRDKIVVPIPFPIIIFTEMRVVTAAIIFGLLQIGFSLVSRYYESNVAYLAHLGGLVGGVAIAKLIVRERKVVKKEIDYEAIGKLIKNEKQREIFARVKEAREVEIKEAWLSYLIKELRCPYCNGRIELKDGKPYCRKCGYIK